MATNVESPLATASFLNMYLATRLKISKIKNDIKEEPNPFSKRTKLKNSLPMIHKNINTKKPEIYPKFNSPWGIQRQSISIKEIQIKSDKKIQLKNILKNKFELDEYIEGELLM